MIKKKDLAKEFELVVKQEIIEHNKSISASNLAVNKLSARLDEIPKALLKEIHDLLCANIRLAHDQEGIEYSFKQIKDEFEKWKRNQFKLNERNHEEINTIDQAVEIVHRKQQNTDKQIDSLEEDLRINDKAIDTLAKVIDSQDQRLSNRLIKSIKTMKEEILSLPSEVQALKKEFMEELSMHKVDNAGLLREIKVLKKTVFINEKKIEHLNTLIERMGAK